MTGLEFFQIRKRLRLNQTALGALMGTYQSTVSRWESLESVPPSPAAFMRCLGCYATFGVFPEDIASRMDIKKQRGKRKRHAFQSH